VHDQLLITNIERLAFGSHSGGLHKPCLWRIVVGTVLRPLRRREGNQWVGEKSADGESTAGGERLLN
jgi:hypothetical protein